MSRTGSLAYHHAVLLVAFVLQMQSFCKLAKIVGYAFLMMRGTWYLVQLAKDAEHTFC